MTDLGAFVVVLVVSGLAGIICLLKLAAEAGLSALVVGANWFSVMVDPGLDMVAGLGGLVVMVDSEGVAVVILVDMEELAVTELIIVGTVGLGWI